MPKLSTHPTTLTSLEIPPSLCLYYDSIAAKKKKKSLSLILTENQFSNILTLRLLCHVQIFSQTYV